MGRIHDAATKGPADLRAFLAVPRDQAQPKGAAESQS
jgi:hypothetical protein